MGRFLKYLVLSALTASAAILNSYSQLPALYEVKRLPFNTDAYNEIAPVIVNGGLIYCSDRRYSGFLDRTSFDGSRIYNQYIVQLNDTVWGEPSLLKSERSYLFTSGPASVSPDGTTIYFSSDVETGRAAEKSTFRNKQGIFIARLSGSEVDGITPFRYNSLDYNLMHPSISADGSRLYFASDMRGGRGRSDIWYCDLVDGEWSAPVNVGPPVNTASQESFPYIHPAGKLYFSSNRTGGTGQRDIYVTEIRDGAWVIPFNLPEPLNSRFDDLSIVAAADRKSGYVTSRRQRSSDDIFAFRSQIIRKEACDTLRENIYWYQFIENRAVLNDSIPFVYEWNFGDGEKDQGPEVWHEYPGPGTYILQLDVVSLLTDEVIFNQKTDTIVIEDIHQAFITSPDTVRVGEPVQLSASETYLPEWEIESYYWNFDNEEIAIGTEATARYLNPGVYDVQLIVTAKPDENGRVKETCVTKKIRVLRQQ
jgi:hypothetical protein